MRTRVLAATAVSVTLLTVTLAGCGTSTVPGSAYGVTASAMSSTVPSAPAVPATARRSASGSSAVLTVRKTPIGYVLADANGYTIYWDANDPRGSSRPACVVSCLQAWFPVTGKPRPAKGVTLRARLGHITRPSGLVQATYNGYPLYTFAHDSAPGMTNGNGSAGLWYVIKQQAP